MPIPQYMGKSTAIKGLYSIIQNKLPMQFMVENIRWTQAMFTFLLIVNCKFKVWFMYFI